MTREFEGCTLEQVVALRADSTKPIGAFLMQRRVAKFRGIEWRLTLAEWWGIWQASGQWSNRGRRHNEYVMCRQGDVGPYSVGNVFIATSAENVSQTGKLGLPCGVSTYNTSTGVRYYARHSVNNKTQYIGTFASPELAHEAYVQARAA